MKISLRPFLAAVVITGFGTVARAQAPTAAPGPAAAPGPVAAPAPATSARAACRAQVDSQSLTGDQRRSALRDCMKPHRDACRQQAVDKGLAKGPDRKTFMHQCMRGA